MGSMKSYECKTPWFYISLISQLYCDIAQCYSVSSSERKAELRVIEDRCALEGFSFLTKTLPKYGKALDRALSTGTQFAFAGFTTSGGPIPKFLGWLVNRVLDTNGYESKDSDPIALKHFRQLVYLLYKLEIPYAPKTAKAVVDAFVQTEIDLAKVDQAHYSSGWIVQARAIIARVVCTMDPQRIKPKHGPGAVATGETILEKTIFKRIYLSLDKDYPFMDWFRYSFNHVVDSWRDDQRELLVVNEPTAKVVLVPKDSRGPRLISCEPLEIQWIQQGLGKLLQEHIQSHRLTSGHVNFDNQQINRDLAMLGSKNQRWVTLDMKEASDRVSCDLVKTLFAGHPALLSALMATRSTSTRLPDGTVLPLAKFAPMGSSLCFPVESLVFWALAVSAIKQKFPLKTLKRIMSEVFVYGDDLIVRREDYDVLLQLFPTVGLMFNDGKCCTAGFFRESCGCDAYKGVDVTPSKLRSVWGSRRKYGPDNLLSYVALSNAMWGMGYYGTAQFVHDAVEERYGVLPYTSLFSQAPNGAYVTLSSGPAWARDGITKQYNRDRKIKTRWNSDLHRLEYHSWSSEPKKVKTNHDGYSEMLRRTSDGFGTLNGNYALVRRNRLKRTWIVA